MTSHFSRPALICNSQSGGHDEDIMGTIAEICRTSGAPLAATFALPDDEVPGAAELERRGIDLLLVWTGDGTINAAATKAAGWDGAVPARRLGRCGRSEEHTSELQSLMRISYAVFCLKKKKHRQKKEPRDDSRTR